MIFKIIVMISTDKIILDVLDVNPGSQQTTKIRELDGHTHAIVAIK